MDELEKIIYLDYLFHDIRRDVMKLNVERRIMRSKHIIKALTTNINNKMRLYVAIDKGEWV